ncbi:hypothetical protein EGI22_01835 [Lacihabitans sp. LS3-19]|uniref:hypothetical protein n=1 Tax=Lacihabitans sp. LS3-19 TaxID=2487335 RepID=UPI0020CD46C8|nr:hypothetical protein [Lacihabitans sp. LS3-19]MCP9766630.1 hypothetical protein [Lacihabitans sp. LS3-19]
MLKYLENELLKQSKNTKLFLFVILEIFLGWLLQLKFFKEAFEVFPYWKTSNEGKTFDDFIFSGSNFYIFLWFILTSILVTILLVDVDNKSKFNLKIKLLPILRFKFILVKLIFFFLLFFFSVLFISIFYFHNIINISEYYSKQWDFSIESFSVYFGLIMALSLSVFLINFSVFLISKFKIIPGSIVCLIVNFGLIFVPYSPQFILKKQHLFLNESELYNGYILSIFWLLVFFGFALFNFKKIL